MIDYSIQNKKAWEYNAYEFWVKQSGTPVDRAKRDLENPIGMLRRYSDYFDTYNSIKVANICGSCGKKAVPLAILGAEELSVLLRFFVAKEVTIKTVDTEYDATYNISRRYS